MYVLVLVCMKPKYINVYFHYITQDNFLRSVSADPSTDSHEITGIDICSPCWFVVRSTTCSIEVISSPIKLDVVDTMNYTLTFCLEDQYSCSSLTQSEHEKTQAITDNAENTIRRTLAGCSIYVTCFAGIDMTCSESEPSIVHFRYTNGF